MNAIGPGLSLLVLLAAALHATWNGIGKAIDDRVGSAALIGLGQLAIGAVGVLVLPVPRARCWPFIAGSALAQSGYLLLLMAAYGIGDFSRTYPLARGVSPLVVTVVSLTVLGEHLSWPQLAGVALVGVGLAALAAGRSLHQRRAAGLAVLTGVVIACYTLLDGVGVRLSGAPVSYAMWLFLVQGPLVPLLVLARRRTEFLSSLAPHWRLGLAGGVLSAAAYTIVVWAQARAPLAAVSALRETSVVLAAAAGRFVFRERLGMLGIGAACVVAAGTATIATT